MRSRHELRHERASARRARKRIRPDAPPTGVVACLVVAPEILVLQELLVGEIECPSVRCLLLHASTIDANGRPGPRARALGGRNERAPARARIPAATAERSVVEPRRLDLRDVGRGAVRRDGGARPARRPRAVRPRAATRGDLPSEPPLAAPACRAARLRAPRDDRRAHRARRGARAGHGGCADRARRLRHRRHRRRARRAPRLRAHLLEPRDAARGHGARDPRVSCDQCARSAAQGRRRDRDGRWVGSKLPARPRLRQSHRRRDHRLPLRPAASRRGRPRASSVSGSASSRSAQCLPCGR